MMIKGLETKIVIVGAGPVGLYCAYLIKKNNPKLLVTIIDSKKEVVASCCSGHVSIKGINNLLLASLIDIEKITLNRIRGAYIYSGCEPNHALLKVRTKQFQTIVIDRNAFDKELEQLAKSVGVEIIYNHLVVLVNDDYIKVNSVIDNKITTIDFNFIIGADGPNSIVRSSIFKDFNNSDFINSYQITANGNFEKDMVSVYFGEPSSNFFSWVIPETRDYAKIGIGVSLKENSKECLDLFIKKSNLKISNIKFNCSGVIPVSKTLPHYIFENKILIGDAACFVKATSGGGLVFGLKSAEILAQTFSDRYKSFKNINNYDKNLKKYIDDLNIHYKIHSYLNLKTPEELDLFFKKLKEAGVENFLNSFGNIDYPSKIIPYVLLHPKFIRLFKDFLDFINFKN